MFESKNFRNEFWRHRNYELWKDVQNSSKLYQLDASFDIVPGLCGVGISFRSVNYPAHFIRHSGGKCFIAKASESNDIELFKKDASWIPHEGIADPQGPAVSFESVNYPGEYIRHSGGRVRKDQNDASHLFYEDATWYPKLLKPPTVSGEWKLVYANDNAAASGQFTDSHEVGTEVREDTSTTTNVAVSWKGSLEYNGIAIKGLFETTFSGSMTRIDSSSWKVNVNSKEAFTINLKKGEPVYVWQWYYLATSSDSTYVTVRTNIFKETATRQSPPPFALPKWLFMFHGNDTLALNAETCK